MPRPFKRRTICSNPRADYLRPRGILAQNLEEVILNLDEYEAVRLADGEQLYQEAAAKKMGVSRQTFGIIIGSARHKIADALVHAKALKIEGGPIQFLDSLKPPAGAGPARPRKARKAARKALTQI